MSALLLTLALLTGPSAFDRDFTGQTLRLDTVHAGAAGTESVAFEGWRLEGPWAGRRTGLVDGRDRGVYRIDLVRPEGARVIYSATWASIFSEYQTTGEALAGRRREFHESVRVPEPLGEVVAVMHKRGKDGRFAELWRTSYERESPRVAPSGRRADARVTVIRDGGPPTSVVDLLIVADGYGADEQADFLADARRLVDVLFSKEPFARRQAEFTVRAHWLPSPESGIPDPRAGIACETLYGTSFDALGLDRYMLASRNLALREAVAATPYDLLVILANTAKYGGGGIYGLWSTCAADSSGAPYVFVHELGHAFAGLGDEYYSSAVTYEDHEAAGPEPWAPNVTALKDPANLKWKDLVEEGTPIPTPWDRAAYDRAPFGDALLRREKWRGKVGAFEGAQYRAEGLYRPELDCLMFTSSARRFCKVCERALDEAITLEVGSR